MMEKEVDHQLASTSGNVRENPTGVEHLLDFEKWK